MENLFVIVDWLLAVVIPCLFNISVNILLEVDLLRIKKEPIHPDMNWAKDCC